MQLKKKDVQMSIQETALALFYQNGYSETKMSDIANEMNISVGNIYTYFKNKKELFYTVVSTNTIDYFEEVIMTTVGAYNDYYVNKTNEPIFNLIEEQLKILVSNYREVVIMLDRNKKTVYEGTKERIIEKMAEDRYCKVMKSTLKRDKPEEELMRFYKIIGHSFIDMILNGLKEDVTSNEERYDLCLALIRYQLKGKL